MESLGGEEGFLRLEPHHFSSARRLSLALSTRDIFPMSDGQFFSYGGDLRPPSFRAPPPTGWVIRSFRLGVNSYRYT
jgi:hypothetical protein